MSKSNPENADRAGKPDSGGSQDEWAYLDQVDGARVIGVDTRRLEAFLHGKGLIAINNLRFEGVELYKPQGSRRALPMIETLREVIPSYLLRLIALTGGANGPIGRQFVSRPELERVAAAADRTDWLEEEEYVPVEDGQPVAGLTHKYGSRVLGTFTYDCAAYCRFCTRGRKVGGELHTMPMEQVKRALDWIENNDQINEVILSGGDPLAMEPRTFLYITKRLGEMQQAGKLEIVRIGTRFPVHNPTGIRPHIYEGLQMLQRPNVVLHVNHPTEITQEFVDVADKMRSLGAILRSQSVLLAGVNDDLDTMERLMNKLVICGISPYYVYTNDRNFWNDHFTVSLEKTRQIFANFIQRNSGLACSFDVVIDTGHGKGKVRIPIGDFWKIDFSQFRDYNGKAFPVDLR